MSKFLEQWGGPPGGSDSRIHEQYFGFSRTHERGKNSKFHDSMNGILSIHEPQLHFFYKNQIIFVEARCSCCKMAKISIFAHTLPLFYAFKMLFRMSTFISNNSMIRNFASSWVTTPDGCKSEPNCYYKVCSYKRKKVDEQITHHHYGTRECLQ